MRSVTRRIPITVRNPEIATLSSVLIFPSLVIYEFCKKARAHGVDIFRVFDSLNYEENLKLGIDAVVKAGGVAEGRSTLKFADIP